MEKSPVWVVDPIALHQKGVEILTEGVLLQVDRYARVAVQLEHGKAKIMVCEPTLVFESRDEAVAHAQSLIRSHRRDIDYTRMLALGRLELVDESLR